MKLSSRFAPVSALALVLGLVSALMLAAVPVAAHHFKGLPHFSYFENYPQVPQDEFLGQMGEFEFSLVIYDFQGIKRDDAQRPNDARLYLVLFNLRENRVYNGPLELEVLDRGELKYRKKFEKSEEESIYTMNAALPKEGKYSLGIRIDAEDTYAVLPFKLSSQKIHWAKWIAAVLLLLVTVVAFGSRRARVAIDRREAARNQKRAKQRSTSKDTPVAVDVKSPSDEAVIAPEDRAASEATSS